MKIYNSLVDVDLLKEYPDYDPCLTDFSNYVANYVNLESLIACAGLFAPEFIEYNDRIYLGANIVCDKEFKPDFSLAQKIAGLSKSDIQKYTNMFELGSFYLLASSQALDNDILFDEFAKIIHYFWDRRLKELFPSRSFHFILEEDMYGEQGLCLTFYEEF